jgi:hypothetical protein
MDEVAREAVLEAMSQNNIKPFDDSRQDIFISKLSIPAPKQKKKKKSGKKKKGANPEDAAAAAAAAAAEPEPEQPKWISFETMKEAIDFGWKVGTPNERQNWMKLEWYSLTSVIECSVSQPLTVGLFFSAPFHYFAYCFDKTTQPGQTFSFVATNVKGQQLKDAGSLEGATRLGDPSAAANFNRVNLDALDA